MHAKPTHLQLLVSLMLLSYFVSCIASGTDILASLSRVDGSNVQARLACLDQNSTRQTLTDLVLCSVCIFSKLGDKFSVRVFSYRIEWTIEFVLTAETEHGLNTMKDMDTMR